MPWRTARRRRGGPARRRQRGSRRRCRCSQCWRSRRSGSRSGTSPARVDKQSSVIGQPAGLQAAGGRCCAYEPSSGALLAGLVVIEAAGEAAGGRDAAQREAAGQQQRSPHRRSVSKDNLKVALSSEPCTFAPNEYLESGSFSVLNLRSTELASGRREYVSPNRQKTVLVSCVLR